MIVLRTLGLIVAFYVVYQLYMISFTGANPFQ